MVPVGLAGGLGAPRVDEHDLARRARRIARIRRAIPGAVIRLPFEATGLAPRMRKKSVRSTSGIGSTKRWPNMRRAATWCGSWSTEVAEKTFASPGRCRTVELNEHAAEVVDVGIAEIDAHGVGAVALADAAEPRRHPLEGLLPADLLPAEAVAERVAAAGRDRREMSCSATALGQMWPRLNGSSRHRGWRRSTSSASSISMPHIASQRLQVR